MTVPSVPWAGTSLLEDEVRTILERDLLPAYLPERRWFAGKARAIETIRILDASSPGDLPGRTCCVLIEVLYRDGGVEEYFLPLAITGTDEPERLAKVPESLALARLEGSNGAGFLHEALADEVACRALLEAVAENRSIPAESGAFVACPTSAFDEARGQLDGQLSVRMGSAEQSNSAVHFGDRLILKVFRRVEPGANPDFEVGRFLTEKTDFNRVPTTAGSLRFDRPGASPFMLGILQGFVRNQGTGWEHALAVLAEYLEKVGADPDAIAPAEPKARLLEIADSTPPPAIVRAVGEYLVDAATLGRRTAEMHLALASDESSPDFAPEPMTPEHLKRLADDIEAQVHAGLAALRERLESLPEATRELGRSVLAGTPRLLEAVGAVRRLDPHFHRIRIHGDYHLGQVLRVNDDYVILDFEGEPAKPLARRLEKATPLRDVVGMMRSFDYAANAALLNHVAQHPDQLETLAPWAKTWATWTSAAFLKAYLSTASGASFLPSDPAELSALLGPLILEKALYELLYELNNRPDWVPIPLHGIRSLIEGQRDNRPPSEQGPMP